MNMDKISDGHVECIKKYSTRAIAPNGEKIDFVDIHAVMLNWSMD